MFQDMALHLAQKALKVLLHGWVVAPNIVAGVVVDVYGVWACVIGSGVK